LGTIQHAIMIIITIISKDYYSTIMKANSARPNKDISTAASLSMRKTRFP
jgi:hypothetical protein